MRTKIFCVIIFSIFLSGCNSFKLFAVNLPSNINGDFNLKEDIKYGKKSWQKLDVYTPSAGASKAPVVIFIHGGKWKVGSKDDYLFVGDALAAKGYVAVLPSYIKWPKGEFPDFMYDAAKAVKWVENNIEKYGGDKNNIYLMGHSAGAHIASLVVADERYFKKEGVSRKNIRGIIGLAGPYAFNPGKFYLTKVFGGKENFPDSQVINFIKGKEPPFLLLHGVKDDLVNPIQSTVLANRIREKGGEVRVIKFKKLDHKTLIASLSRLFKSDRTVLNKISEFICTNTKKR